MPRYTRLTMGESTTSPISLEDQSSLPLLLLDWIIFRNWGRALRTLHGMKPGYSRRVQLHSRLLRSRELSKS